MKTESKMIGPCRAELVLTLAADEAGEIVKKVERAAVAKAKMPGFRAGKVPLALVRKVYAPAIEQNKCEAMIAKYLSAAAKERQLALLDIVKVEDFSCTAEGGSLTVAVDVKPVFELPKYKGLEIEKRNVEITDKEVEEILDTMRKSISPYEDAEAGAEAAEGDFACFDYSGTLDGKPLAEVVPEAKTAASGTGVWMTVEEGRFLPELIAALKGMKVGDKKEGIEVSADLPNIPEELRSGKVIYTVELKQLRKSKLLSDEELAKALNLADLDAARKMVRESRQARMEAEELERRRQAAADKLCEAADFDLPECAVATLKNQYLRSLRERAEKSRLPADYFEAHRKEIDDNAQKFATGSAKLQFICEKIAEAEKLEIDETGFTKVLDFVIDNAK